MSLITYTAGLGLAVLIAFIMVIGRDLLVPFMISVVIWYMINTLSDYYQKIHIKSYRLPRSISYTAALLTMVLSLNLLINMITNNIAEVKKNAPEYQENFMNLVQRVYEQAGIGQEPNLSQIVNQLDLGQFILNVASSFASLAGSASLILIYVIFLMLEQKFFSQKINALLEKRPVEASVREIIERVSDDIETYVGIKTFASMLTGAACYLVLIIVGVDNASFWAFLIFLLNYIPTIGSMMAVIFPSLLCLVQFGQFSQFFITLGSLAAIQFSIGNIIEPRLMGNRLNLSPLVVMLSLSLWGSIWGIAGMFLSVPFTVILMIIFSQFRKTEPIAILLSQDGLINSSNREKL